MKRLPSELLMVLLLPLCSGATTLDKAGYMIPQYFSPLTKNAATYDFTSSYVYEHDVSKTEIIVRLTTYYQTGGASKKTINSRKMFDIAVPCTLTFTTSIDYDDIATGKDYSVIEITYRNEGFVSEFYSIRLAYSENCNITIDKENGYCDRSSLEGWYEDFSGDSINEPARYEWKGFAQTITDPDYMLFPLRNLKIRMRGQTGLYENMAIKSASISIFDIENFKMGTKVNFFFVKKMVVDLSWSYDSSHYTVFRTKNVITYSPDFREVRTQGAINSYDKNTHAIFLPPIKNGEVRNTRFSIDLLGVGVNGRDSIHSYFDVIQTRNYIGSYPVSEYYVEEC